MYKAGVSVFNGLSDYSLDKNLEYIKKAKDMGCEIIFSSAHINEANNGTNDLQKCLALINQLDMKLSLDISKPAYEKMSSLEGLYAMRLDYGFGDADIVELSQKASFLIELNASTMSNQRFEKLIQQGLNLDRVRMSFNYYPKKYTGHDFDFVKERVAYFHQYQLSVGAFLPSHIGFRPPMYEGLPTIEEHRTLNLDLAIEELKAIGVDEILFGDAYVSMEEMKKLTAHQTETILIPLKLYEGIDEEVMKIYDGKYKIRSDYNQTLLRFNGLDIQKDIEPFHTTNRFVGDVTIDNVHFLRYQKELNIVLKELEKDERVNVIGHIEVRKAIINRIMQGSKFKFILS